LYFHYLSNRMQKPSRTPHCSHFCWFTATKCYFWQLSDLTWKRISQKLIFWRHDWEARVLSCDLRDYLSFSQEMFRHSTSVSILLLSSFFLSSFIFGRMCQKYLFLEVQCHCIRWGIRFHVFLATNKEWFFSGFSYLAWYITVIFHTLVLWHWILCVFFRTINYQL